MNVAFIPVRGGSKSIPHKNIKIINGHPLVFWVIKAACNCQQIDKVYVSTDCENIKNTVDAILIDQLSCGFDCFNKCSVIGRTAYTATDTASTESAMLEFAENYEFDNIVLIQATSPLLRTSDLDKGFELYKTPNTDSIISVVNQKRMVWTVNCQSLAIPVNYDPYNRPRRQDCEGFYVENGAFYITSKSRLLESKNRVSGTIRAIIMDEDTFYEIDTPDDWIIVERLMHARSKV